MSRARVRLVVELQERHLEGQRRPRASGRRGSPAGRRRRRAPASPQAPTRARSSPSAPRGGSAPAACAALLLGGRVLGRTVPHERGPCGTKRSTVTPIAGQPVGTGSPRLTVARLDGARRRRTRRRAACRPARPRRRGGWRPPAARAAALACASLDAAWKPNETMPRSRWLLCGSSATSHCSCVAIGACRRKWRAGTPPAAGSKASVTATCGWYSSATSTTSLPGTANRVSRPGRGAVLLEGHRERAARRPGRARETCSGLLEQRHAVRTSRPRRAPCSSRGRGRARRPTPRGRAGCRRGRRGSRCGASSRGSGSPSPRRR